MRNTRKLAIGAGFLASSLVLAGCTSGTDDTAGQSSSELTVGSIDLAAAGCPSPLKIATDWFPEAEHGHLYELVGEDPIFESESEYSTTGPLVAGGEYTGIEVSIISAGSARADYLNPDAVMYADEDVFMGYVGTDEAVVNSDTFPTVGVFAPLEKDPQMIMWDPETYPDVESIADLGETGVSVRVFPGGRYIDYFVNEGILSAEQIDATYDGAPDVFVAQGGSIAQQGFASAEPYIYENEIDAWGQPVAYELINDAGYPKYAAVVSVTPENLTEYSSCLEELVPVLQQAAVDYYSDPTETNELILDAVEAYNTYWVYSAGVAEYSVETQLELGLVSNGGDDTIGNLDPERVQEVLDLAVAMYAETEGVAEGLTIDDIYTNEFIDESIGLD